MRQYIISVFGFCAVGASIVGFYIWRSKKFVTKNKLPREEIEIPNDVIGHVIGRYGGKLEEITTASHAKIKLIISESSADSVKCIIKGRRKHIKRVSNEIKRIIQKYDKNLELVNQTNEIKSDKTLDSLSEDMLQDLPSLILNGLLDDGLIEEDFVNSATQDSTVDFVSQNMQKLFPIGGDDLIPVYVSAITHPKQFWVQSIKTAEYAKLDSLSKDLAEFYRTTPSMNVPPPISVIQGGFLCALYVENDDKWYRTEINEVIVDDKNIHESTVDLYLLDTGESLYGKIFSIRAIPPKFLQLNFQAIQCSFRNIEPADGDWTDEAYTYFVKITQVANGYKLMARVINFASDLGSYYIDLYDTNCDIRRDLEQELVRKHFAKYIEN